MTSLAISRRSLFLGATAAIVAPRISLPPASAFRLDMECYADLMLISLNVFTEALQSYNLSDKQIEYLGDAMTAAKEFAAISTPHYSHEYYIPLNAITCFPEMVCFEIEHPSEPHAAATIISRFVRRVADRLHEEYLATRGQENATLLRRNVLVSAI